MRLLSGLDLCILSSCPVVLSYLFQVLFLKNLVRFCPWILFPIGISRAGFPVRYFLSENVLCVDRIRLVCRKVHETISIILRIL